MTKNGGDLIGSKSVPDRDHIASLGDFPELGGPVVFVVEGSCRGIAHVLAAYPIELFCSCRSSGSRRSY